MSGLSLVSVNLATVLTESFLYGIFFVLFVTSVYLFVRRAVRGASGIRTVLPKPLFWASILMFVTTTGHWILTIVRAFNAFVHFEGGTSPDKYFGNLGDATRVTNIGLGDASLVIGDAVLVYRLWVIWSHSKKVVVIPLICFCGTLGCCLAVIYEFSLYNSGEAVFVPKTDSLTTGACALMLFTNLYCSSLIAWRIWSTHARVQVQHYGGSNLMRILAIFIQSAILYVTWAIFYLCVYESRSNLQFTVIDTAAPISGIAFMMINVHVAFGWTHATDGTPTSFVRNVVVPFSPNRTELSWFAMSQVENKTRGEPLEHGTDLEAAN